MSLRHARVTRIGQMVAAAGVSLALLLAGCSGTQTTTSGKNTVVEIPDDSTDQMFNEDVHGAKFYVFQVDDETMTTDDYHYPVDVSNGEPLRDGGFYEVVADVRYLNGGIAGYVNYPEIKSVTSCTEVSPLDIGLPSISDKTYGLTLIGDYADGDVLFFGRDEMLVWKDGNWIRRFNKVIELPDGTKVGVREGVSESDVQAGIQSGVLSCDDYFAVLPTR